LFPILGRVPTEQVNGVGLADLRAIIVNSANGPQIVTPCW